MRYHSRMDEVFIVTLLSASRIPGWRRCHVDACQLRVRFTGKMAAASEDAICMPGRLLTNTAWKLLAVREIPRFGCALATSVDTQCCRSVGIWSIRLDEPRAATYPRETDDLCHMAGLAGAEHFLMVRFCLIAETLHRAGAKGWLGSILFCGPNRP
jgi:hypothetical protein